MADRGRRARGLGKRVDFILSDIDQSELAAALRDRLQLSVLQLFLYASDESNSQNK
jgi:hypothetical protein